MKIRSGFISNSSSSSFVVAVEGNAKDITLTVKVDLSRYADATVTTVEDLDRYIVEEHGWEGDALQDILDDYEWLQRLYANAMAAINAGKQVLFCTVGNDYDEAKANLLYDMGVPDSPGIDILDNVR